MRLWSLHPCYLDQKGLVAVWREGLLARAALKNQTKGYRHHPQLTRFRLSKAPIHYINVYLKTIYDEAKRRNYNFNFHKLEKVQPANKKMEVTSKQLEFEFQHLLNKLKLRDPRRYKGLLFTKKILPNPIFKVVDGEIEIWEKI